MHGVRQKDELAYHDLLVEHLPRDPGMLHDLKHMLQGLGFEEGNTSTPGDFVIERAFAEQ